MFFFPASLFNPSGIYFLIFFQVSHSYLFIHFIYLFLPHLTLFNKTWRRENWNPFMATILSRFRGDNNLEHSVYNSQTCIIIILYMGETTTYIFFFKGSCNLHFLFKKTYSDIIFGLQISCKSLAQRIPILLSPHFPKP